MKRIILDQLDIDIIRLLQEDATYSTKEIAFKLKKVNTTIITRLSKLKKDGIILKNVAVIDRRKFDDLLIAFTHVQVNSHSADSLITFQEKVQLFTEVVECYHMTGAFDFLLKIVVRDMAGYNNFLVHKLAHLPNIGALQSYFVIHETKREVAYPI